MKWLVLLVPFLVLCSGCATSPDPTAIELERIALAREDTHFVEVFPAKNRYWLYRRSVVREQSVDHPETEFDFMKADFFLHRWRGLEPREIEPAEAEGMRWFSHWIDEQHSNVTVSQSLGSRDESDWTHLTLTEPFEGVYRLGQRGTARVVRVDFTFCARRYAGQDGVKAAYWDFQQTERVEPVPVERFRYFDKDSPNWSKVREALKNAGLEDAQLEDETAEIAGRAVARRLNYIME